MTERDHWADGARLGGKVAVITGGSTGFGRAIAVAYAREGANIVVGDVEERPAPGNFDERPELTTAALIEEAGGEAMFHRCDVTRSSEVDALVEAAAARFGRLDVMVNNAGVWRGGPFLEIGEADLDACWSVIVKGSWFGAQAAMRRFIAQGGGGHIINIVSTAGLKGHAGQACYNVAKAAQANLTRCLALEGATHAIRANVICPTFMRTAMSRPGYDSEAFRDVATRSIPVGRWGEAADVAACAVFLASDEAAFLDGALIPLDGGETLGAARSA